MHNRALHDTLAAFVEEAAWQLAEEVSGGAEIPFELINAAPSSRGAARSTATDHRRSASSPSAPARSGGCRRTSRRSRA